MIPKIAHFVWYQPPGLVRPMSKLRQESADSFARHNPDWDVRFTKHQLEPEHLGHPGAPKVPAHYADLWKYKMLSFDGGIAFDTDIVFHAPFPDEYLDCDLLSTEGSETFKQMALLGAKQGISFFEKVVDEAEERLLSGEKLSYQRLGVKTLNAVLSNEVKRLNHGSTETLENYAHLAGVKLIKAPYELILPFPWPDIYEARQAIKDGVKPEGSVGIHWFGGGKSPEVFEQWFEDKMRQPA